MQAWIRSWEWTCRIVLLTRRGETGFVAEMMPQLLLQNNYFFSICCNILLAWICLGSECSLNLRSLQGQYFVDILITCLELGQWLERSLWSRGSAWQCEQLNVWHHFQAGFAKILERPQCHSFHGLPLRVSIFCRGWFRSTGQGVLWLESVSFHVCFHFCVPLLRSCSVWNNGLCWVEGTAQQDGIYFTFRHLLINCL